MKKGGFLNDLFPQVDRRANVNQPKTHKTQNKINTEIEYLVASGSVSELWNVKPSEPQWLDAPHRDRVYEEPSAVTQHNSSYSKNGENMPIKKFKRTILGPSYKSYRRLSQCYYDTRIQPGLLDQNKQQPHQSCDAPVSFIELSSTYDSGNFSFEIGDLQTGYDSSNSDKSPTPHIALTPIRESDYKSRLINQSMNGNNEGLVEPIQVMAHSGQEQAQHTRKLESGLFAESVQPITFPIDLLSSPSIFSKLVTEGQQYTNPLFSDDTTEFHLDEGTEISDFTPQSASDIIANGIAGIILFRNTSTRDDQVGFDSSLPMGTDVAVRLSTGAIVGIVLGSIFGFLLLILLCLLIVFLIRRRKAAKKPILIEDRASITAARLESRNRQRATSIKPGFQKHRLSPVHEGHSGLDSDDSRDQIVRNKILYYSPKEYDTEKRPRKEEFSRKTSPYGTATKKYHKRTGHEMDRRTTSPNVNTRFNSHSPHKNQRSPSRNAREQRPTKYTQFKSNSPHLIRVVNSNGSLASGLGARDMNQRRHTDVRKPQITDLPRPSLHQRRHRTPEKRRESQLGLSPEALRLNQLPKQPKRNIPRPPGMSW